MYIWEVLKKTFKEFVEDTPLNYSSTIAFYVIFSLPAILMIVVSIGGSAYEDQVVRENLLTQIQNLFGTESSTAVEKVLENASASGSGFLTKVVGFIALGFSATTVFISLQDGINRIWNIKSKPEKDWVNFLKNRLLSLAMVVSIGFLLLVSLGVDTFLAVFKEFIESNFSELTFFVVSGINLLFSFLVITLVFALIFKILPDAVVQWKDVWIGAVFTTLLFVTGKFLMGLYLGSSALGSVYGAAGSLVLLLLWVYFSAIIALLGAQFTFVFARERGRHITPKKHAVFIEQVEQERED
ncbi:MAG: YihY/virulence factor BrkB family protein [Balneolaceae bacterium]|nr:YihY/virulence factor BrkB family protein [Balneolaceae bacterium]MBO6546071.1 YihY/virulence factor BrkB family protein [Balneolaceae bacterium]MBO6647467.1 YihY/virulence factor BrkB family protein [Balneolaceae bacterium]